MSAIADDTAGGFNAFVDEQKKVEGECRLTLVQFDTEYEFVHRAIPIADVPLLDFHPRGMTALLDAVGRAVSEAEERIGNGAGKKVIFVIITDGLENSSREFKKAQVKDLIGKHDPWQFVFLGANVDAFAEAGGLGIDKGTTSGFKPQNMAAAYLATSGNIRRFRSGQSANVNYSEDQRKQLDED